MPSEALLTKIFSHVKQGLFSIVQEGDPITFEDVDVAVGIAIDMFKEEYLKRHGGGSGKWSKLIKYLGEYYGMSQEKISSIIADNDRIGGPAKKRFVDKKHNLSRHFDSYFSKFIKDEVRDLTNESEFPYFLEQLKSATKKPQAKMEIREVSQINPLRRAKGMYGGKMTKLCPNCGLPKQN